MLQKKTFALFICCALLMGNFISCKKDNIYENYQPVTQYNGTIYDYLKSQPDNFQNMLTVLGKAGFTNALQHDSLTFFAPTDQSLQAAMDEYNIYLRSQGMASVTIDDIDSSSWRSILSPYLVHGGLNMDAYSGQDGLMMTTLAMRQMHGLLIKHNASGVNGIGASTIEFSYPNGSKFIRDWISTLVSTPGVQTKNGIINILESRHVLGFNYFINKAKEPQNIYSETRTFASGSIAFPDKTVRLWQDRVKKLTAIDANTVETEAADLLASGYLMRLTVMPNDSISLQAAPSSADLTIEKNGPCFFNPVTLTYTLNYRYTGSSGYRVITETIGYIAEAAYIH